MGVVVVSVAACLAPASQGGVALSAAGGGFSVAGGEVSGAFVSAVSCAGVSVTAGGSVTFPSSQGGVAASAGGGVDASI